MLRRGRVIGVEALSRRLKTFYFHCFDFAVFKSVASLFLDHSPSADFGNSVGGQKNAKGGFHPNGYVLFLIPFLSLVYSMLAVSVHDIVPNRSSLVPRLFVILPAKVILLLNFFSVFAVSSKFSIRRLLKWQQE